MTKPTRLEVCVEIEPGRAAGGAVRPCFQVGVITTRR